jgi:hypothetical protein
MNSEITIGQVGELAVSRIECDSNWLQPVRRHFVNAL